jgi:hypothetical protein
VTPQVRVGGTGEAEPPHETVHRMVCQDTVSIGFHPFVGWVGAFLQDGRARDPDDLRRGEGPMTYCCSSDHRSGENQRYTPP